MLRFYEAAVRHGFPDLFQESGGPKLEGLACTGTKIGVRGAKHRGLLPVGACKNSCSLSIPEGNCPEKTLVSGAQWGTRECHGSPVMGLLSTRSHGRGRPRTRMRSLGGLKRSSWWSWPWGRILRENPVLSGDCLRTELPW